MDENLKLIELAHQGDKVFSQGQAGNRQYGTDMEHCKTLGIDMNRKICFRSEVSV